MRRARYSFLELCLCMSLRAKAGIEISGPFCTPVFQDNLKSSESSSSLLDV